MCAVNRRYRAASNKIDDSASPFLSDVLRSGSQFVALEKGKLQVLDKLV